MARIDTLTADVGPMMKNLRIIVRIPRMFRFRIWLACQLFKVAGHICGANVAIEIERTA